MKLLLLAISFLATVPLSAAMDSSTEEIEAYTKLIAAQIDYFFKNFDGMLTETLEGQDDSVAIPLRKFADCVHPKHDDALKQAFLMMASALISRQPFEERAQYCNGSDSMIITDLYLCANLAAQDQPFPDFAHAISNVAYFPFHLICSVENVTEYLVAVSKLNSATIMDQFQPIKDRYNEIIDGKGDNKTAADACLPIEMAKVAKYAMQELGSFDRTTLDYFQEYTRVVLTLEAKLPFVSYGFCFMEAGDLLRKGE